MHINPETTEDVKMSKMADVSTECNTGIWIFDHGKMWSDIL